MFRVSRRDVLFSIAAFALGLVSLVGTQASAQGVTTQTIITARGAKHQQPPTLQMKDVQVKAGGKHAPVTGVDPLIAPEKTVQLAFVMDDSLRTSVARQLDDIRKFFMALPPSVQIGVGFMENGRVLMPGGFQSDHAAAAKVLRMPIGAVGISASPYFCISDLVKHWPGAETPEGQAATKIIFMVTNGVDPYNGINPMNQQSPYVDEAVKDAQAAGVPVFSLYYADTGLMNRTGWANLSGQSYLSQVAEGTGGRSYYQGTFNPVTFLPYFDQFRQDLANMYLVSFTAEDKKGLQSLKVTTELHHVKLTAPQLVNIGTLIATSH